jgi:hypothetical protein
MFFNLPIGNMKKTNTVKASKNSFHHYSVFLAYFLLNARFFSSSILPLLASVIFRFLSIAKI